MATAGNPELPGWVMSRPRIGKKIVEDVHGPLTVVTGLPRVGKTMAIASWSCPVFSYLGWIILGWLMTWAAVELNMFHRLLDTTWLSGRQRVVVFALSLLAPAVVAAGRLI